MSVRLYKPSNGSEGEGFFSEFCHGCQRDAEFRETEEGPGCLILARALMYDTDAAEYPREWTFDAADAPTCTAFVADGEPVPMDREYEAAGQAVLFPELVG